MPYPDVIAQGLVVEGRADPTNHQEATYRIEAIQFGHSGNRPNLPVAALPARADERYLVQRGKIRPAVVLTPGSPVIPKSIASGSPGYLRRPCAVVVPCYTADREGRRAGFPEELIERIRQVEYPQFLLDELPIANGRRSIFRFDHVLAVGADPANFNAMKFRLSDEALLVLQDWLNWYLFGSLNNDGLLSVVREELLQTEAIV